MITGPMLASTAARFCAAGASIANVSLALAMLALVALLFGNPRGAEAWCWWLVASSGGAGAWYRFRLGFDAGVFADIAAGSDSTVDARIAAFDSALLVIAGRSREASGARTLSDRVLGARRLVMRAASVTAAQAAVALFVAMPR